MSARVYIRRQKQSGVTGAVRQRLDCKRRSIEGHVYTPQGIVLAHTWDLSDSGQNRAVSLKLLYNGHFYVYYDNSRSLTARGLTTVAGRFARDVAAGRYEE